MAEGAAPVFALMPFFGLAAIVAAGTCALRWFHFTLRELIGPFVRASGYALVLAVTLFWCASGLYEGDWPALLLLTLAATAGGVLACLRPLVVAWLASNRSRGGLPIYWLGIPHVLFLATAAGACALELPWNDAYLAGDLRAQLLELAVVALAVTGGFFFAQRRGVGPAVVIVICAFIGLAQYFVVRLKGESILPRDVYALGTALAVRGGYTFAVGSGVAFGLAAACAGIVVTSLPGLLSSLIDRRDATARPTTHFLLALAGRRSPVDIRARQVARPIIRSAVNLAVAICSLSALVSIVTIPNYAETFRIETDSWSSVDDYKERGFLSSFIVHFQSLVISEPEGYSTPGAKREEAALASAYDEKAAADEGRLAASAQFDEIAPSVVVVMNETFSDLSVPFELLRDAGYEGPTRFNAIDDALMRGSLAVSVHGGSTCNTEFEFLTGTNLAFVGEDKYPYTMYDFSNIDNLARQFSDIGYTCSAIHPLAAANWNRNVVYPAMGFDAFYADESFAGAPWVHSGPSDAVTYDRVLELLKGDDSPQFIFDVTVQNHGGYDQGNMPEDLMRHYELAGLDEETAPKLDEYLACIESSDRALEKFMRRLSDLDRPVVLVFFGDHQPDISIRLNDELYPDDDALTHMFRIYQTHYLIWANYDVAGRDQLSASDTTSADTLAAMTLDLIGAPLTKAQRARIAARAEVPSLNVKAYQGSNRLWYLPQDETPYREMYQTIARISYLEFGERLS